MTDGGGKVSGVILVMDEEPAVAIGDVARAMTGIVDVDGSPGNQPGTRKCPAAPNGERSADRGSTPGT